MAPGRLQPDASTSLFRSDGLNDAQTSELGRLSAPKGGLPLRGVNRNQNPQTLDRRQKETPAGRGFKNASRLFPPVRHFSSQNNMAPDQPIKGLWVQLENHSPSSMT